MTHLISVKNKNYQLKTKKYYEKLCDNLSLLNIKKAIDYDFIFNHEKQVIEVKNIEHEQSLPKDLSEVLCHLILTDVMTAIQKKKKMDENVYLAFVSNVITNPDISLNLPYILIEVNEWLLTDSFYNLDTFIDFRLRKYKDYFATKVEELYKEEQILKENIAKSKELENYLREVFEKNFGLDEFHKLYVTLDNEGGLLYKTESGLELTLEFIQDVLGVFLQFSTDESSPDIDLINRGKILNLFIVALDVAELDITDIVDSPSELSLVSNIFYTLCNALGRQPIFINRNSENE